MGTVSGLSGLAVIASWYVGLGFQFFALRSVTWEQFLLVRPGTSGQAQMVHRRVIAAVSRAACRLT